MSKLAFIGRPWVAFDAEVNVAELYVSEEEGYDDAD